MAIVPGAFGDLFKASLKQEFEKSYMGLEVSHEMIEDDMYSNQSAFYKGVAEAMAASPPESEPFPDKLPEIGPETRWQRIWREMWGLVTAEENWSGHCEPVIKWYRLHYAITREAKEGRMPFAKRFAWGWYDHNCDVWHYYVVPLNLVVSVIRYAFHQIAYKIPRRLIEKECGYYFKQGFRAGYRSAAKDLDKHNILAWAHPYNPISHLKAVTATTANLSMQHHIKGLAAKQKEIAAKMQEEIHKQITSQLMVALGIGEQDVQKYIAEYTFGPGDKPYLAQYLNNPHGAAGHLAKKMAAASIPFPGKFPFTISAKPSGQPPPIEAGTPVSINGLGEVYPSTISAECFGIAIDAPNQFDGNVPVQTSPGMVTLMKSAGFVSPPSSLEAKHED
jgi:hypothetical protein